MKCNKCGNVGDCLTIINQKNNVLEVCKKCFDFDEVKEILVSDWEYKARWIKISTLSDLFLLFLQNRGLNI